MSDSRAQIRNPLRAKLEAGELAVGVGLHLSRTVAIPSIAARCGFDWLMIDLEHTPWSIDTASEIAVASIAAGMPALVRVGEGEYSLATRLLDAGAWGVILPHVDTAEEAREAVHHLRYPPTGERSVGYNMPHYGYESVPHGRMIAELGREVLIFAMVESGEALSNIDAIAAVPGIDGLMIGTSDLCISLGIVDQKDHALVSEAYEAIVSACRAHGKWPAMGGVYADGLLEKYVGMGIQLVLGGADMGFFMEAASKKVRSIRSIAEKGV